MGRAIPVAVSCKVSCNTAAHSKKAALPAQPLKQTALFGVFFNGSSLLQGRHHSGDQNQLYDNARHGIE